MMSFDSPGALSRKRMGTSAHKPPSTAAFVTVILMARGETIWRGGAACARSDLKSKTLAGITTNSAQAIAFTRPSDGQNEATSTTALKIMASRIQGVLRSTPLNCSALTRPAIGSSRLGPPKTDRSPEKARAP